MLPKNYKLIIENNLEKLWNIWRTLGFFSEGHTIAMSPEEAIIGLCILGRYDQRLFDEALSFILFHSRLISKNRLKFNLKRIDDDSKKVFCVIASILKKHAGDSRFVSIVKDVNKKDDQIFFLNLNNQKLFTGKSEDKLFLQFGFKRNTFVISDKTRNLRYISQNNPWIKAKLIFGNTIRADIAIELINSGNCIAPVIASKTGYSQKSVWNILKDFEIAGFVNGEKSFNRIVYTLTDSGKKQFSQFRIKNIVPDVSEWIKIGHFISALKKLPKDASELLIQSEEKRVERLLKDLNI